MVQEEYHDIGAHFTKEIEELELKVLLLRGKQGAAQVIHLTCFNCASCAFNYTAHPHLSDGPRGDYSISFIVWYLQVRVGVAVLGASWELAKERVTSRNGWGDRAGVAIGQGVAL